MDNFEIQAEVQKNNARIDEIFSPTEFILNKELVELTKRNKYLQSICVHDFDELGYCKFCGLKVD